MFLKPSVFVHTQQECCVTLFSFRFFFVLFQSKKKMFLFKDETYSKIFIYESFLYKNQTILTFSYYRVALLCQCAGSPVNFWWSISSFLFYFYSKRIKRKQFVAMTIGWCRFTKTFKIESTIFFFLMSHLSLPLSTWSTWKYKDNGWFCRLSVNYPIIDLFFSIPKGFGCYRRRRLKCLYKLHSFRVV